MIQEALLYHTYLIKIFLLFLFISLALPWILNGAKSDQIKALRISFFIYSALLAMIAFSGMVLALIAGTPWNLTIGLMVAALVLLTGIEIARSRKLTSIWREGGDVSLRSLPLVTTEIVIVAAMIVLMIMVK